MSEPIYGDLVVFSGTAHPQLAESVCRVLGIPLGPVNIRQFSNENIFVQLLESVRAKDVFVIQPFSAPVSDHILELLIFIDALRRDSAGRITAVIPYYAYGRTDKKDQPRVPITARLLADLITTAGADRFLTFDLHAGQIQGFFTIPTDELRAFDLFVHYFRQLCVPNAVVVSPDLGAIRRARNFAERLDLPLAIIEKRRSPEGSTMQMFNVIGNVEGHNVILIDDEIDTAATLCKAAAFLVEAGAEKIYACATHAVFSDDAVARLAASPICQIVVADTMPVTAKLDKLTVLSVSPLLAEVIRRIHRGESVGAVYDSLNA